MLQDDSFSLTTSQTLAILRALPANAKCYEFSSTQEALPRYIGTRDDLVEVFSHPAQPPDAPTWNVSHEARTRHLAAMTFRPTLTRTSAELPRMGGEYCVLLDYSVGDDIDKLPNL